MAHDERQSELAAFIEKLRVLPIGDERTELIASAERLGRHALPALLDCLARADARHDGGEASQIWTVFTRMITAGFSSNQRAMAGNFRMGDLALGSGQLELRDLLLIYRAMMGRKEQGAVRCRAKCSEELLYPSRERLKAASTFRELGLEPQLAVRWDEALQRGDHAALWEQVGVWLCASPEQGAAKMAIALMQVPDEERWYLVQMNIERCEDDFQRAAASHPEFFRWAEARTLEEIKTRPRYQRLPALRRMLSGSAVLAQTVR